MTVSKHIILAWVLVVQAVLTQGDELLKVLPVYGAEYEIGTNAIVFGKVTALNKSNDLMRIVFNFRSKPVFSAIIRPQDFGGFSNLNSVMGKTIKVKGMLSKEGDRPFMVLTNRAQLQVVESALLAEETAIRVAALTYAFESDREFSHPVRRTINLLDSDLALAEVVRGLSRYRVTAGPIAIEELSVTRNRDQASADDVVRWSVHVVSQAADEVEAQVNCQQGMLRGLGWLITLEKQNGVWTVIRADANRLS